ncbi:MAG: hypothetical protein ACYTHK_11560 [Planctomycetota bacterium]|jgi:hypothetical protein
MGKGILAAFLGALAMFAWGFVSWMVLHLMPEETFKNEGTVAEAMRSSGNGDGVYFVPLMPEKDSPKYKDWEKNFARGPRAVVVLHTGEVETDKFMITSMAKGFAVMFAACFLLAILLGNASIKHFMGRFLYCVTIGGIIAVFGNGSGWAWFHYPLSWTIPGMINDLVAWACAGAVMGAIIKP